MAPMKDGTGPQGQGAQTGRGMGPCGGGMRRGAGRGMGNGMGRRMGGRGMGRGNGFGPAQTPPPQTGNSGTPPTQ